MGKRASLEPACSAVCVDVDRALGSRHGVLCSIENVMANQPTRTSTPVFPAAKKQKCLELDQASAAPTPLDLSFLFSQARGLLRQPPACATSPPIGRDQQSQQINKAVQDFVDSGVGKSVYVSGLPGTGKSHTVRKVLQQLTSDKANAATITWINCMSVTTPSEVYAQIVASAEDGSSFASQATDVEEDDLSVAALTDSCLYSSPARCGRSSTAGVSMYQQLVQRLSKLPNDNSKMSCRPSPKSYRATRSRSKLQPGGSNSSDSCATDDLAVAADVSSSIKRRGSSKSTSTSDGHSSSKRHIIVLDEIDNLAKKSTAALVQLFLLPHEPGLQVLLIGIANSIDLTERTLPELKMKLVSPELICFPAYSTKQLAAILSACMEALPCKLFEPPAIELCARSVATSSGDLRHALKACRAAVDELERQHKQQEKAQQEQSITRTVQEVPTVTARYMIGALKQLASGSVRSSHFGAQATSSIRSLPNQQQLLLYSLSVLCRPKDSAAEEVQDQQHKRQKSDASSLWKAAGSAVSSSVDSKAGKKLGPGAVGSTCSQQIFVLSVGLDEAYSQYKQVCKLLSLPPCTKPELLHMAELLSLGHTGVALVEVSKLCGGSSGSSASLKSAFGGRGKAGLGGLGGLGGRGLASGGSKLNAGAGIASGKGGEVRLSLKASVEEVEAALQHNPALRCLVQK